MSNHVRTLPRLRAMKHMHATACMHAAQKRLMPMVTAVNQMVAIARGGSRIKERGVLKE